MPTLHGRPYRVSIIAQPPIVRFGKPPKVTDEITLRIAERIADGLPLKLALSLETPVIPLAQWSKSIQEVPRLAAIFDKKLAERMHTMLLDIGQRDLRKMPATVWILERRFSEYFGNVKSANVTINQTVIGLGQDILQRGQRLLRKQVQQAIDVQSKPGKSDSV